MAPGPSDDERRLAAQPQSKWDELWVAVDELDGSTDRFRWRGGREITDEAPAAHGRPVVVMPYVLYSDEVERVLRPLAELGVVFAFQYQYPAWKQGARYAGGNGLADAPVADAARLLSAIVLADRFCEGTIAAALDDGGFDATLARLRRWQTALAQA